MTERRYVVGTETPAVESPEGAIPDPGGVWHAVDAETRQVSCGSSVTAIFDDHEWEAKRTSVLCQRCLRAVAGWS